MTVWDEFPITDGKKWEENRIYFKNHTGYTGNKEGHMSSFLQQLVNKIPTARLKMALFVLGIATILLSVSFLVVAAQSPILQEPTSVPVPTASSIPTDSCENCHTEIHAAWHQGAHGDQQMTVSLSKSNQCTACHKSTVPQNNASGVPAFEASWVAQGRQPNCLLCHVTGYDVATNTWKADGISCEACHIVDAGHPQSAASISQTAELCRRCHTGERFGWESWQESKHFTEGMLCSTCHDPHTNNLKIASGEKDASSLCKTCHTEEAANSQHAVHETTGVSCVACHLGKPTGPDDFHQTPKHDFKPSLQTCLDCHQEVSHDPGANPR
jgi:predicted CXXCH cytochrome family protein